MDQSFSTFEVFSWTPIIQVVILSIGTLISFVVAYGNGAVSVYLPFIRYFFFHINANLLKYEFEETYDDADGIIDRETGAEVPEMCLFTLALAIGSTVGCVVICYRNLIMRYQLLVLDARLKKLNDTSTVIGLISMFGLVGVAAFPMSTVLWVHLVFATIHFLFGMMYVILQTFINYYVPSITTLLNRFRIILCALLLFFLFMLVIFFPLSYFKWNKVNDHPPAIKKPEDEVFGIMISSALFEWLLYSTFMTLIASYFYEFRRFKLVIGVVPVCAKPEDQS